MNVSFSGSTATATQGRTAAAPPVKRRFGHGFDQGEDEEEEVEQRESKASLTGYDASSSLSRRRSPPPRVIPVSGGSDWREDRRKRLALAQQREDATSESATNGAPVADRINSEEQKSGLQVRERKGAISQDPTEDVMALDPVEELSSTQAALQSEDDLARQALLSGQTSSSTLNSNRTISLTTPNEEEAFRSDASTRPDAPTLDDYAATPVEEFGKALLRGMGWKEGMGAGKNGKGPTRPAEVKKRSALLGLGAKERPGGLEDGKGKSGLSATTASKAKRPDVRGYKPLVRREMDGGRDGRDRRDMDGGRDGRNRREMDGGRDGRGRLSSSTNGDRKRDRDRDVSPPTSSASSSPRHERDRPRPRHARSRSRSPVSSSSSRYDDRRRDKERERSHRHHHRSEGNRNRDGHRRGYDDHDDRRDRDRDRDRDRRR